MRIGNLDAIRGFCVVLVVIVHMSLTNGLIIFGVDNGYVIFDILSFYMPPFYFFSGFLFSDKRNPTDYIRNKSKKLGLPYLFFGLLSVVVFWISKYCTTGEIPWFAPLGSMKSTMGLLSNTPLWFLFSLFAVTIIYYFINKYFKKKWYIDIFVVLCFVFAFLIHDKIQLLSCGNIALGIVYYHLGYKLKKLSERKNITQTSIFLVSLSVFLIISYFDPQRMSFVLLNQIKGHFLLNLPWSLSVCYILWFLNIKIAWSRYLSPLGFHSLVIFTSHRICLNWIYDPIIRYLNPYIDYSEYILMGHNSIHPYFICINKKDLPFCFKSIKYDR